MKPLYEPIRNLDDLTKAWRLIDGGHGYSAPQLFALPSMTSADRRWIRGQHEKFEAAPYAFRPLFFATDTCFGVVPPDELIAHAS